MPLQIYGRRPLSLLEAGLYAGFAAILLTFVSIHLLEIMEMAERLAVEATLSQVVSGVSSRLAVDALRGGAADPAALARRNPFDLAGMSVPNFVGEIGGRESAALSKGSWAFDAERAELVYLPRLSSGLHTSDPEGALRFRAVVGPRGLSYTLAPTNPYRWE